MIRRIIGAWLIGLIACTIVFFVLSYSLGFIRWDDMTFWEFAAWLIGILSVATITPICQLLWRHP